MEIDPNVPVETQFCVWIARKAYQWTLGRRTSVTIAVSRLHLTHDSEIFGLLEAIYYLESRYFQLGSANDDGKPLLHASLHLRARLDDLVGTEEK